MKIRTMTATFGKLERAELRLEDGMNILTLPNEGGKTTWCAFLLAMLYGVDTSERAAKGSLPVKTRYKPWSGAAMEGRMELNWQGREITIERFTRGRIPMGEFRAYETGSGLPVRELTAENCGLQLLGVERAVFERSAFLRQSGLKIERNGALEQRLTALVTTGEETLSCADTEKRLREWRNAVRHNRTGELPRLERELEETEETLRQIRTLQSGSVALRAQEEEKQAELAKLRRIAKGLRAAEVKRQQTLLERAEREWRAKQAEAEAIGQAAVLLPNAETLQQWQMEWSALQSERRSLPAQTLQEAAPPQLPRPFAGRSAEEIRQQAETDFRNHETYERASQPLKRPFPWLAAVAAVASIPVFFLPQWYLGFVLLAVAGVALAVFGRNAAAEERERKNAALAAEELLRTYGVRSREAILRMAETAQAELEKYEQLRQQTARERQSRRNAAEDLAQRERQYLEKLNRFLPDFAGEPVSALSKAMLLQQTVAQMAQEAEAAARNYAGLAEHLRPVTDEDTEPLYTGSDLGETTRRAALAEQSLREIRSRLDRCQGQISALGDPAELEAKREQLLTAVADKRRDYEALTIAMEALGNANDVLQTQFAPEISRRAGAIMAKMTAGKYDRVMLDEEMAITTREADGIVSRELPALSQGTGDQLYLAVRLAICDAALSPEAPLILDDALVNFDDERAACAMALLQEEAERRQILLFTCHNREKKMENT